MKSIEEISRKLEHWQRQLLNTQNLARKLNERLLEIRRLGLSVSTIEKLLKLFDVYDEQNTIPYIYKSLCAPLKVMFGEFLDTLQVSEIMYASEEIEHLCTMTSNSMLDAVELLDETLLEIEQATSKQRKN